MGSSGKHHSTSVFRFRKTLIAVGAVLTVVAAAGVAFAATGNSSDHAGASAGQNRADLAYQDRAARSAPRSPLASPSASPTKTATAKPKPKPKPKRTHKRAPAKATGHRVVSTGSCQASYYSEGQTTASGESFDPSELTAAHKTLPFGTKVKVTNRNNGESAVVRINDRGPYVSGRCLDLSTAAMRAVGGMGSGVIPVRYQVLAES
ncbi:MAG TPA: septal ring lytic transglycosylase RlpA family protein [Streptosporangiaceae bacterium]